VGKENIPSNCPVIFAPNHLNSVMDAIAILTIVSQRMPLVFLARSDVFKGAIFSKILHFLKIMPAFRMVDGINNLQKNQNTFNQCINILHRKNCIGIMPEGNQGEQHRIRPIMKGIFRIAFGAQQKWGNNPMVKIIPVGINMGHLIEANKHIIINIGKPIEISDYMISYNDNEIKTLTTIKNDLKIALSNLTLDISSNLNYDTFYSIIETINLSAIKKMKIEDNTINRFISKQMICKRLLDIERNDIDRLDQIKILNQSFQSLCKSMGVNTTILDYNTGSIQILLIKTFWALSILPLFVLGVFLNFFPVYVPVVIRKIMNVEYEGFFSSIHFGIGLISYPFFYIFQSILLTYLFHLDWKVFFIFILVHFAFRKTTFEWYRMYKDFVSKWRYILIKTYKKEKFNELNTIYQKLNNICLEN
jgi:hypothetical protein